MDGNMINISTIHNKLVFVDTSALYALFNENDTDHQSAVTCMHDLVNDQFTFLISNFIIDEIYTLLLTKANLSTALFVVEYLIKEWIIKHVETEDEDKALNILRSSIDKTYSYTDATTFALMERLKIGSAFSFDNHFFQYGLIVYPR
ncbi:MAG: type II toxin-antitoxin system VapC family toxin [Methanospirillaceae archaeon]|nr:type II toxin-antitoxin system VapC family toxin [Methanospirillaceae archaeon]